MCDVGLVFYFLMEREGGEKKPSLIVQDRHFLFLFSGWCE